MRNTRAVVIIISTTCHFGQVTCHMAVMFTAPRVERCNGGHEMGEAASVPVVEPAIMEDVFVTDVLEPELYDDHLRIRLLCERGGERFVVVSIVSTYPATRRMLGIVTRALADAFARWH